MKDFNHPPPLHSDVQKHLLPIYENLSRTDLLERCLGGYTQNANESFNSTVWRFAPKHLHCGIKTVETAAYIAAGVFNEGYGSILKIMDELKIVIGQQCRLFAEKCDSERIERQERRSISSTREARLARREEQSALNEFYEKSEGLLYVAGTAD